MYVHIGNTAVPVADYSRMRKQVMLHQSHSMQAGKMVVFT